MENQQQILKLLQGAVEKEDEAKQMAHEAGSEKRNIVSRHTEELIQMGILRVSVDKTRLRRAIH